MTPYEQGRKAYQDGLSFFDNPFFDTDNPAAIKEWAAGWGAEQLEHSRTI
jgi:hypothetical protein